MLQIDPAGLIGVFALSLNLLLLAKIAFQPASDRLSKRLCFGMLVGIACILAKQLYLQLDLDLRFPHLAGVTWPVRFLLPPVVLAYVLRMTRGVDPFANLHWPLHLIPAIAVVLFLWPFYIQDTQAKLATLQSATAPGIRGFLFLLSYVQLLGYLYICQRQLNAFQHQPKENSTDVSRINVPWLRRVCAGLVLLPLVDIVLPMFGIVSDTLYNLFLSATALFIVILAYSALGRTGIAFDQFEAGSQPGTRKYLRSGLREDSAHYYLEKLERLVAEQRVFLDHELSLSRLAAQLNMSPHHLSQVLNESLGLSFHDYINGLRIEHAKSLLMTEAEKSVESVAYDSGYSNKGTFYNAFRARTGMTPRQFQQEIREGTGTPIDS